METGLVGIGTGTPNAMLDVTSTTAGFAMPRMTSVQRKAIAAPIAGLQVYDTDLKGFYFFDGTKWDCANNPAGTVQYFANVTPPDGYLECNGQAVSRTAYAELFAAIGTTYGVGDGSTTFNVPDLRGEFIRGYDDGRGADPGRTIGSWQSPSPLVHDDTYGAANQDTDFSMDHAAASYSDNWPGALAGGIPNAYWGRDNGYAPPSAWQVYSGTSAGGSAYGMISGARPRSVALMPCIKF
ncbi:MAG: tail fiber protein [Bacteroidetes bacterium]|nr:tail fiber protein [Bacteroidota bacterium]